MHRRWSWYVASVLAAALAAAPAAAATMQERTVEVTVRGDGAALVRTRLQVRLEQAADLDAWSRVVVALDENKTLESILVEARTPTGQRVPVGKDAADTHELTVAGELHGSVKARSVRVPRLPLGSVLTVAHAVLERPYFPGGLVMLQGEEPTERLHVVVNGPGGVRFRVDGETAGIVAHATPGGVEVTGTAVTAAAAVANGPARSERGAVLRYAWGPQRDWPAVGEWYASLMATVPRGTAAVQQAAGEAAAGATDARSRLEQTLAYVRRRVRYVAVEVGIGGYRPGAPDEVLKRGWGDCKDKAILLADMLGTLGVTSHLALIAIAPDDRIDREFPSPFGFNHVIVAVPAAQLARTDGLPAAGGYVFVDPTQESGGLEWLAPGTQGQDALVVRPGGAQLVTTPIAPRQEGRQVAIALVVAADRSTTGSLRVELLGQRARDVADALRPLAPEDAQSRILRYVTALWPAARVADGAWSESLAQGVPATRLSAHVTGLDDIAGGASLGLPDLAGLPAPSVLEARTVPVVLRPGRSGLTLRLDLPPGLCAPAAEEHGVDNASGRFVRRIRVDGRSVTLEHESEVVKRWFDPQELPALRELSLAEARAQRRRVRLDCER